MDREGTQSPEVRVTPISHDELQPALERAKQAGYLAVHCGRDFMSQQYITVDPRDAENLQLWWSGHAFVNQKGQSVSGTGMALGAASIEGLAYGGIFRRTGRLHKYQLLDSPPEEIQPDDLVALRKPDGSLARSLVVMTVEAPYDTGDTGDTTY